MLGTIACGNIGSLVPVTGQCVCVCECVCVSALNTYFRFKPTFHECTSYFVNICSIQVLLLCETVCHVILAQQLSIPVLGL